MSACPRRVLARLLLLILLVAAAPARAGEQVLALDPAATEIRFVLGATLHRVEGSIRLVRGAIRFDPETGAASGELVIDATSARTGLARRDENMHADVLESERYPEIVFRPEHLGVTRRDGASADVELRGRLSLHGEQKALALPAKLVAREGRVGIESRFRVPYVDWGMRAPSSFLLRVDRYVEVTVRAEGVLTAPRAAGPAGETGSR